MSVCALQVLVVRRVQRVALAHDGGWLGGGVRSGLGLCCVCVCAWVGGGVRS